MNADHDERGKWTSASAAAADLACPGRHQSQLALPELPSTPEQERGVRIHDWLAGVPVTLEPDELETAEMLKTKATATIHEWLAGRSVCNTRAMHREQRQWVESHGLRHSGRSDLVALTIAGIQSAALVLDFKTGWGDVPDPALNQQLRDYAVIIDDNVGRMFHEITVAIIDHRKPRPVTYNRAELTRAAAEMWERIRRSHTPGAPRIAGTIQCQYCRFKEACPERAAWLATALPSITGPGLPMITARDWTPQQRAQFCDRKGEARKWLEARERECKQLLTEDPNSIPGWTLEEGNTVRTIVRLAVVLARFVDLGGTQEQFVNALELGIGRLKELLGALTGKKGKALDAEVTELIQGCVELRQNSPSIAKL